MIWSPKKYSYISLASSAMHLKIQFDLLPFSLSHPLVFRFWIILLMNASWIFFFCCFLFFSLNVYYVGLSTSHFAWAFHSVAEEELLSMLPAVQKGDPTWSELRAMGVGWWVRNIHSLRKCIEKVIITF